GCESPLLRLPAWRGLGQPTMVTNGAPPTAEYSASTRNGTTISAAITGACPVHAPVRAPSRRVSRPHPPATMRTCRAVATRSPNPAWAGAVAAGPTSEPTVRVTIQVSTTRAFPPPRPQQQARRGCGDGHRPNQLSQPHRDKERPVQPVPGPVLLDDRKV